MPKMSREDAIRELKSRTPEYLQTSRGVVIRGRFANGTSHPFRCISPNHQDKTPSMFYSYEKCTCFCRSCEARYDIFDMVGEDYGLPDFDAQLKKGCELYGIEIEQRREGGKPLPTKTERKAEAGKDTHTHTDTHTQKKEETDYSSYYAECSRRIGETDYYRGLSPETLARHRIGYEPHFKTVERDENGEEHFAEWKAFIIPTSRHSFTARNTDPNATKSNRYRKRGYTHVLGIKALQTATRPIFVVEGEIDALSIEDVGGAAVALGSFDNVDLFLRELKDRKLSQPPTLIIALDEEKEPDKRAAVVTAEEKLAKGLETLGIPFYRLHPWGEHKDANEALCADREAFAEAIAGAERMITQQAEDEAKQAAEEERAEYLATSAGANLQAFIDGIAASVSTEPIPTGFKSLDGELDGGLFEGLHIIGGISSLGKTSLVMQLADSVARAGTDVLIFSLEMARSELMAKSISRHTLEIALRDGIDTRNAKTMLGITRGSRYAGYSSAELDLIKAAVAAYGGYAGRIFIQEGIGNVGVAEIRETVERHIRITGRTPLIVLDYLQILAPANERATDKQNTDKAVLELKRISRDFKLPVIAVSSFNRSSYREEVAFEALKESGSIEYSSDTVLGLQLKGAGKKDFDSTVEKKRDPRLIELVILKNRRGKVGAKIAFEYYPKFNLFRDMGLSS